MSMIELDWRLRLVNGRYVNAAAEVTDPEEPEEPTTPEVPPPTIEQQLAAWTNNEPDWTWSAITPHSSYPHVVSSASVIWPDKSAGTYTLLTLNTTYEQWDSFKVTHARSGKTVTVTVKGRTADGLVTGYTTTIT